MVCLVGGKKGHGPIMFNVLYYTIQYIPLYCTALPVCVHCHIIAHPTHPMFTLCNVHTALYSALCQHDIPIHLSVYCTYCTALGKFIVNCTKNCIAFVYTVYYTTVLMPALILCKLICPYVNNVDMCILCT